MLRACYDAQIPLYLVFSSQEDIDNFAEFLSRESIPCSSQIHPILCTGACKFPPVYKRIFGLQRLIETTDFDFIIAPDADIAPVHEHFTLDNLANICTQFFNDKRAWGGKPTGGVFQSIWNATVSVLSEEDQRKLRQLPPTYTWFSDAPIWERRTTKEFLNRITPARAAEFDFNHCFDNMMYMFFLVLHHGFTFHDAKIENGVEAVRTVEDIERLASQGFRCTWLPWILRGKSTTATSLRPILYYHTDRK